MMSQLRTQLLLFIQLLIWKKSVSLFSHLLVGFIESQGLHYVKTKATLQGPPHCIREKTENNL